MIRIIALALLLAPLTAAMAQPSGTITGTVLATGTDQPIVGAQLAVEGSDRRAITDAQGRFAILGVAPGVWRLQVRAIGYRPVIIPDVVVGSGKPTTLAVRLLPAPTDVAAVEEIGRASCRERV